MSNSISKSCFVSWYLKSAYFCAHDYMKVAWQLQLQRQRWFYLVQQSIVLSSSVNRTLITHLIKECSLYTLKETAYNASGIRSHLWAYPINTIANSEMDNLTCVVPCLPVSNTLIVWNTQNWISLPDYWLRNLFNNTHCPHRTCQGSCLSGGNHVKPGFYS